MKTLKSNYYLYLALFIISCSTQHVIKGYGPNGMKVRAHEVKHTEFYLDTTVNRIEARETLGNVIALLIKKSRGGHDYDCFNRPMPNIELIIEKPKGQRISEDEILQVIKDSFGYVIEKQDFWIEKMKLLLVDSNKLKEQTRLYRCIDNRTNFYEVPTGRMGSVLDVGFDTIYSTLDFCLSFLSYYYQPMELYPDTFKKEGVYIADVNQHRLFEFKRYNNEILPFDAEFEIDTSFGNLKYYCARIRVPQTSLGGNIGYLYNFLQNMGILLKVKVEKRSLYTLKCIGTQPGQ